MRSLGLTHLTLEILKQRKHFEQAWSTAFHDRRISSATLSVAKREGPYHEQLVCAVGCASGATKIIPTLTFDEMLQITIEGIKNRMVSARLTASWATSGTWFSILQATAN